MEFLDEQLNKVSQVTKILPYVLLSVIMWLFFMTILVVLLYFNILDIKSIVEGMKQCVVSLNIF